MSLTETNAAGFTIDIPPADAMTIFTTEGAIDPILAQIRAEVGRIVLPSADTPAGRKEINSFAFKVTKSRTFLEGVGKTLAAEAKAIPKKIDATRRKITDNLEALEAEVRKPVSDWEAKEARRQSVHSTLLAQVSESMTFVGAATSVEIEARLAKIASLDGHDWEEFELEASRAIPKATRLLNELLASTRQREIDQAELAVLRAKQAQRDEADRTADEAAERERAEAAEREFAEQRKREIAAAAEQAVKAAAAQAAADALAKEQAEKAAADKRAANKKHQAAINNAVLEAFVTNGFNAETAKSIVKLIASGVIPSVTINY